MSREEHKYDKDITLKKDKKGLFKDQLFRLDQVVYIW